MNPRYVAYYLTPSESATQKPKVARGMKVVEGKPAELASRIYIPVLPLSEHRCIVDILDRFKALTASLTDGLPRD